MTDFLNRYDPSLLLPKMMKMVADFNRQSWGIIDSIRRWWITKVRYPLFRRMVRKTEEYTADLLYDHPDYLIFVITRYFVFLVQYCQWLHMEIGQCLDGIFPPGSVYLNIHTEPLTNDTTRITGYEVIVRTLIPNPVDLKDRSGDKYAITRLEVDVDSSIFKLSQVCYDTNDPTKASTSRVLFDKQFNLQSDGTLYNPNYAFSKELFEEDMNYFKLMISQLMVLLGGMIEVTTTIFFMEIKS